MFYCQCLTAVLLTYFPFSHRRSRLVYPSALQAEICAVAWFPVALPIAVSGDCVILVPQPAHFSVAWFLQLVLQSARENKRVNKNKDQIRLVGTIKMVLLCMYAWHRRTDRLFNIIYYYYFSSVLFEHKHLSWLSGRRYVEECFGLFVFALVQDWAEEDMFKVWTET